MKRLTRIDLDIVLAGGCQNPDCQKKHRKASESMFMTQKCHPKARLDVRYSRCGSIFVICAECRKEVCEIAVANE